MSDPNTNQALHHLLGLTSWAEGANADNLAATATKAAGGTATRHYVTGVSGSFSAAAAGKELLLKDGATVIGRWYVHNQLHITFPVPIEISDNAAAEAVLAASGTLGVLGAVTLTGFTV
jgi:hypothetical protein